MAADPRDLGIVKKAATSPISGVSFLAHQVYMAVDDHETILLRLEPEGSATGIISRASSLSAKPDFAHERTRITREGEAVNVVPIQPEGLVGGYRH